MSTKKADKSSSGLSRRDLLRRTAVGAGTVAVVGGGATRLDHGPVQETKAIAPAVAAAGIGASAATGWILRETEIIGSDDPPEGLTPEALEQSIIQTFLARESNYKSTFVDNQNILEQADQAAYSEGKLTAFEMIEAQESESDVLEAAKESIDDYFATIQRNFFKSWNEAAEELDVQIKAIREHDDLSMGNMFYYYSSNYSFDDVWVEFDYHTYELADGSEFEIHNIVNQATGDSSGTTDEDKYSPVNTVDNHYGQFFVQLEYEDWKYLKKEDWDHIPGEIDTLIDEVHQGIETWVEGTYSEVQSGEIDTSQLLTPSDRSEMTSDDEGFAQAHADLQSLNISTDIEREAEVYFTDLDTSLYGQLAYSGDDDISTGEIDPDELDGVIYLTYDLAQGSGLWTEYEEGLDGGILSLTERPPSGYAFEIVTTEDETAIVSSDEFEQSEDDPDKYTADLSDQLEDTIVDFEIFLTTEESTQYETTRLDEPFEIVTFRDSDGEEYDSASFESSEPHTDDNYISQEEWEESQQRHEELIEKYEDSQDGGGAGFGGDSGTLAAAAAVGAAIIFLLGGN